MNNADLSAVHAKMVAAREVLVPMKEKPAAHLSKVGKLMDKLGVQKSMETFKTYKNSSGKDGEET